MPNATTTPEAPENAAKGPANFLGFLGQTGSALETVAKIITTLVLLGGAVSTFTQQGMGRIIAGVVALISVTALLWWLRRPLRASMQGDSEPAVRPSLRGLLHFDVGEPLYERKRVLDTLYGRTIARGARVNILLGDPHCGKTSLLLAGLVTALERSTEQPQWLPVYVAHPGHTIDPTWDAESAIAEALAHASGTPTGDSLGDALARAIGARPDATFVIIYDQFEQFFLANPRPEARAALLDWVGACVREDDLAVRFVFGVRTGFEAYVAELEAAVGKPVSVNFQTTVSRFQPGEARHVLDAIAEHDQLPFTAGLRSAMIRDLTKQESICPAELQIVGKWLYERGICTVARYEFAGQVDALFTEFLNDQAQRIDRVAATSVAERILLALSRRGAGHTVQALSRDELVQFASGNEPIEADAGNRLVRGPLDTALAQLMLSGLVIEQPDYRYRLVHDYFADYVINLGKAQSTFDRLPRLPRALAAAYGTTAAAGVIGVLLVLLFGACTFAQTKASRIDTLQSSTTLAKPGFTVFGVGGQFFAVGEEAPSGLVFRAQVWNLPSHEAAPALPQADLRTPESQQASVKRWVDRGYTVLFVGESDQAESRAVAAVDPDHVRVLERADAVAQLQIQNTDKVAYMTQTTLGSDEITAVVNAIRARLPGVINADRPHFVPLGLEFGQDARSLRLVTVSEISEQWGVWSWDLTQPQRPPTYRTGPLDGKGPDCPAERATISQAATEQTLVAIGYQCGPILLVKPDSPSPVYPATLNRQTEEQNCSNDQLFFAPDGDLYGLYRCTGADDHTAFRLRPWTPSQVVWDVESTDPRSPRLGDLVLRGSAKPAIALKFDDDPIIRGVAVDPNDDLRAVVRSRTSVELRAVDQGKRLSWLDVGDLGDASPSPDGRFVVRTANSDGLTAFDLYEMGAWLDTGTPVGSVRLWSWMESLRNSLPLISGA
jgi:conflict system STAND superfamily ATPase/4-hydroxy-3-methylbut-2-enyl diphosphate reductase LytB-like protein